MGCPLCVHENGLSGVTSTQEKAGVLRQASQEDGSDSLHFIRAVGGEIAQNVLSLGKHCFLFPSYSGLSIHSNPCGQSDDEVQNSEKVELFFDTTIATIIIIMTKSEKRMISSIYS